MKKYTLKEVDMFFEELNWTLLESNYKDNKQKLECLCPEGHLCKISLHDLKSGRRCKICFNIKQRHLYKLSQEYIENQYKNFGYKLISKYIKCGIKDVLICPNGHCIELRYEHFKRGVRCKECYAENNIGENHPNWNKDRTRERRLQSLKFRLNDIDTLSDDPNYQDYLINTDLYHVDHIFPRVAFIDYNIDKKYGIKFTKKICNSRENLKIITKEENLLKGGKYNQMDFLFFIQRHIINLKIENTQL